MATTEKMKDGLGASKIGLCLLELVFEAGKVRKGRNRKPLAGLILPWGQQKWLQKAKY